MSITLETYEQDNIYCECRWDKYVPHYQVFVGRKHNDGLIHTLWHQSYGTVEQAKCSFKRQIKKIKEGDYQ